MKRPVLVALSLFTAGLAVGVAGTQSFASAQQAAQQAAQPTRTMLLTVPLPELPGKEMRMWLTDLPAGSATAKHSHPGHLVGYLISGTMTQQVEGQPVRALKTGAAWEEHPGEVHVGANASKTAPARLIAMGIYDKGAPLSNPAP
jgi:quercetin dioxygenase-like cupin family protein